MSSPTLDLAAEKNEKNKEKTMKEVLLLPTATLMPMPALDPQSEQTAQIMNAQALAIQRHCIEGLLTLLRLFGKVVTLSVSFIKRGKRFCTDARGLFPVGTNCPLPSEAYKLLCLQPRRICKLECFSRLEKNFL
jgi:hypothetical protein